MCARSCLTGLGGELDLMSRKALKAPWRAMCFTSKTRETLRKARARSGETKWKLQRRPGRSVVNSLSVASIHLLLQVRRPGEGKAHTIDRRMFLAPRSFCDGTASVGL